MRPSRQPALQLAEMAYAAVIHKPVRPLRSRRAQPRSRRCDAMQTREALPKRLIGQKCPRQAKQLAHTMRKSTGAGAAMKRASSMWLGRRWPDPTGAPRRQPRAPSSHQGRGQQLPGGRSKDDMVNGQDRRQTVKRSARSIANGLTRSALTSAAANDPATPVVVGRLCTALSVPCAPAAQTVHGVPVQLLVGWSLLVQRRQPLLCGGRFEQVLQVPAGTQRPPRC